MKRENATASVWVFGYGSLVAIDAVSAFLGRSLEPGRDWRPAWLNGFRRAWNAALDNDHDVPGDKYFVTPAGHRPRGTVSFVGLVEDAEGRANGVLIRLGSGDLPKLDRRERRYRRRPVTRSQIARTEPADGPVYAYVTRRDALERHRRSVDRGTDRVAASYFEAVRGAFGALGAGAWEQFRATTDAMPSPVEDLHMRRLPAP